MNLSLRCIFRAAFLSAVIILSGCASRIPLTKSLIREYNLNYSDIKRLQLYISDDLLLEQEAKSVNKDIDHTHSLMKVEDQYIKRVYFKSQTPCIAAEAAPDRLQVSFEPADKLTFVYESSSPRGEGYVYKPEKRASKEELSAQATGSLFNNWKIVGEQKYGDSTYNVIIKNDFPLILVDQASLRTFLVESRTVPGMRQMDFDKGK